MRRLDAVTFTVGSYRADASGRLVVSARIARTGVQDYWDHKEYRPEEEVFAPASVASFDGAPVTVGHVDWIDRRNIEKHAVGFVARPRRDGEHLAGELVIFDEGVIARIKSGQLKELSAGYSVDSVASSGSYRGENYSVVQRNIRANHVALGPKNWARCGASCSIL